MWPPYAPSLVTGAQDPDTALRVWDVLTPARQTPLAVLSGTRAIHTTRTINTTRPTARTRGHVSFHIDHLPNMAGHRGAINALDTSTDVDSGTSSIERSTATRWVLSASGPDFADNTRYEVGLFRYRVLDVVGYSKI